MNSYQKGFINKCAEFGVDPASLIKRADKYADQAVEKTRRARVRRLIGNMVAHGIIGTIGGANIGYAGTRNGTGAAIGAGVGALGGTGLGALIGGLSNAMVDKDVEAMAMEDLLRHHKGN